MSVGGPFVAAVVVLAAVGATLHSQPPRPTEGSREIRVDLSGDVFVPTGIVTVNELGSSCCRDELLRSGVNTLRLGPGRYRLECRTPRTGLELPINLACDPVIVEVPEDAAVPVGPVNLHFRHVRGIVAVIRGLDASTSRGGSIALVRARTGIDALPPGWRKESADWRLFRPDAPAVVLECADDGPWIVVVQHDGDEELIASQACAVSEKSLRYVVVDVGEATVSVGK